MEYEESTKVLLDCAEKKKPLSMAQCVEMIDLITSLSGQINALEEQIKWLKLRIDNSAISWRNHENKLNACYKIIKLIKNKEVNVTILLCSKNVEEYNKYLIEQCRLSENEYKLLKEVLK